MMHSIFINTVRMFLLLTIVSAMPLSYGQTLACKAQKSGPKRELCNLSEVISECISSYEIEYTRWDFFSKTADRDKCKIRINTYIDIFGPSLDDEFRSFDPSFPFYKRSNSSSAMFFGEMHVIDVIVQIKRILLYRINYSGDGGYVNLYSEIGRCISDYRENYGKRDADYSDEYNYGIDYCMIGDSKSDLKSILQMADRYVKYDKVLNAGHY